MKELILFLGWTIVLVLLLVICIVVLATAFNTWQGNRAISKCRNIPAAKAFLLLTYINFMTFMYKRRHPRAGLMQIFFSLCKAFEREKIFLTWINYRPLVMFFKPEAVEILLNNSINISKSIEYRFLSSWLGTGLLTSDGNKWRKHRKLLTPAFHFEILDNFMSLFNEQSSILTKKLELEINKKWIDIVPMITMCTLDIICETAMGVHLNSQSGYGKEYVDAVFEISDIIVYRALRPWLWIGPIFLYCFPSGWQFRKNLGIIHGFIRKVIKEKKEFMIKQEIEGIEEVPSKKPKKKAFLELLLEHHLKDESLTEEEIKEEVDTFMFEGHDTTAMSVSWTLYELGHKPEVQEKIFQELDDIFGFDSERDVTSDDLKKMKYLECVIKESLRLNPSVAFIARKVTEDFKVGDYIISPGCTCIVCIIILHRDPKQFPNPEVFNPDRFLPENNSERHPYAFIPFSAGPRNCIGQRFALMEEKVVLTHILRKFRIKSLDPHDKVEKLAGLVLKNAEPLRIKLTLREKQEF